MQDLFQGKEQQESRAVLSEAAKTHENEGGNCIYTEYDNTQLAIGRCHWHIVTTCAF